MKDFAIPTASFLQPVVARAAGAQADHIALEDALGQVSYGVLLSDVENVADGLPDAEAGPLVFAIHGVVDRDYVKIALALWSKGHIVLPIDSGLPQARKDLMIGRDWVSCVIDIAQSALDRAVGCPIWTPSRGVPVPDLKPSSEFASRTDAAYVTFSSGTTGTPKAILGHTESLANFIAWQADRFSFGPKDRVPVLTSPAFDPYLREMLTPLFSGATLILSDPSLRRDPNALVSHFAQSKVTRLHAVPTLARHWAAALEHDAIKLPALQTVFFAGEPLSSDLVTAWRRYAPDAEIVNLYGPSETTLARFYNVVTQTTHDSACLPVGRPLPNSAAVILDGNKQPVSQGQSGEVFIDTADASFGTVEDGWTSDTMINDYAQFGPQLYPTGDLGRIEDGQLVIESRKDGQAKVAGIRFHPLEIQHALRQIDAIADAAVFVDRTGNQTRILAIFVPQSLDATPSGSQIRHALAAHLPAPLIPSHIAAVPTLPITTNGKIDKAQGMVIALTETAEFSVQREVLEVVLSAFRDALSMPSLSDTANFYACGGDSIAAARIAHLVSAQLDREIASADVLARPSVKELGSYAQTAPRRDTAEMSVLQMPAETHTNAPLSQRQLAYQSVCMADGDHTWCILSRVVSNIPTISESDLRAAILNLAKCHDALRMCFPSGGQDGRQSFVPADAGFAQTPEVQQHDLSQLPQDAFQAAMSDLRAKGSCTLFDLTRAPLVRAALVKGPDGEHLVLWAHHLILDGPSLNAFASALRTRLETKVAIPVDQSKPGYRAFIDWQIKHGENSRASDRAYWTSLLQNFQPVRVNERRKAVSEPEGFIFTRPFTAGLVADVQARAASWQCTPFVILLAAYMRAIAQRAANPMPTVLVPMQAKGDRKFADTWGLFFTMALVRLGQDCIRSDGQFAQKLSHQLTAAGAHCEYEFHDRICDVADPKTSSFYFPLTTALFNQNRLPPGMHYNAATPMGLHGLGRSLRFQIQGEMQSKGNDFLITYLHRETTFADEGGIEVFADLVEAEIRELVG